MSGKVISDAESALRMTLGMDLFGRVWAYADAATLSVPKPRTRLGAYRIGEGEIVSTVLTQLVRSLMGCRILGRRGRRKSCSIGPYVFISRVSVSGLFEKNNGTNSEKVLHCFQNSALIEKKIGTT